MTKLILAAGLIVVALGAINAAQAASIPCEEMLKQLRSAQSTTKPSDADQAKINELMNKGIERCNADDDKRADDFFAQAMAIMGK